MTRFLRAKEVCGSFAVLAFGGHTRPADAPPAAIARPAVVSGSDLASGTAS